MGNKRTVLWMLGICAVVYTLLTGHMVHASAPTSLPSVMTSGSSDTSKVDSGLTDFVKWGIYFAYTAGSASIVAGIVLCAPIFQKQKEGKAMAIGGIFCSVAAGLVHLILNIAGSLVH